MAVYRDKFSKHSEMGYSKFYQGIGRNTAADLPPDTLKTENTASNSETKADNSTQKHIFDGLIDEFLDGGIDSDKLLIAAILYLLIKEGADIKLIIALGYILI